MTIETDAIIRGAFAHDQSVHIVHVESIAAGKPLILGGQVTDSLEVDSVAPRLSQAITVVKLFVRTNGPATLPHQPNAGTDVGIEVLFPSLESIWNGRIRVQIFGGFAGSPLVISKSSLARKVCSDLEGGQIASELGYLVATSDMGHISDHVEVQSYLMNDDGSANSEGWKNVAWQATSIVGRISKAMAQAYYGRPASRSYLFGCSTGGRAAYHSAQKFPNDFDGLLVGCPSITQSLLFPSLIHPHIVIQNDLNGQPISDEQLNQVSLRALAAGDTAVTGQHDGYFTFFDGNHYDATKDPSIIAVTEGGNCTKSWALSLAQCRAINKIWYGPTIDGKIPDPATDPGSGIERSAKQLWWGKIRGTQINFAQKPRIIAGGQLACALKDFSYAPPEWAHPLSQNAWLRWSHEEFAQAMLKCKEADKNYFEGMDADDPDLRQFQKTGNKILVYHGLADDGVAPQSAVKYWQDSSKLTGGINATQAFHRLFLIPGMGHCVRSRGCVGTATIPIPTLEELFHALVDWVESDKAPDFLLATSADQSVSRYIYPYPAVPEYDNQGDVRVATSFRRKIPEGRTEP